MLKALTAAQKKKKKTHTQPLPFFQILQAQYVFQIFAAFLAFSAENF